MKKTRRNIFVLVLTVTLPAGGAGAMSDLETVTYADFSRINHIASSMTHVYFATTEGIIRYNKSEGRWEEPLTGAEGIDNRDLRRIWVDMFDEKLYVQTSTGSFEYDLLFERWFPLDEIPPLQTNSVHIRPPEVMHPPAGFNYASEGVLIDRHGRDFYFSDILDDRSGNLWIGTWGYGALTASSSSSFIELLPFGLLQNRVDAIFSDEGVLWLGGSSLGGFRSGITAFDPYDRTFSFIESGVGEGLPEADISCFEADDEYIYVGTHRGLFLLDRDTRQVQRSITGASGLADDQVLSLAVTGDSVFVGTVSGMNIITVGGDSVRYVRPRQFSNVAVYDFATTDTSIWIASSAGAYQLLLASGRLQRFRDPHSIIFSRVYSAERYEQYLWLASDGGMVRLDLETSRTTPFVATMGGVDFRPMAVAGEVAAITSSRGVTLFFLDDERQAREREFSVDDGLPSHNIRALLLDDDYLWIGSDRGLTRFLWNDPGRID
ncbi:MAG: hypothetical protein JSW34_02315 [Candidatus Zixiibacteriota bacterium]|nr:MAG: hypothetical protein JSW34_02315 [candidate division Zixibacteria bacterium]